MSDISAAFCISASLLLRLDSIGQTKVRWIQICYEGSLYLCLLLNFAANGQERTQPGKDTGRGTKGLKNADRYCFGFVIRIGFGIGIGLQKWLTPPRGIGWELFQWRKL